MTISNEQLLQEIRRLSDKVDVLQEKLGAVEQRLAIWKGATWALSAVAAVTGWGLHYFKDIFVK